ncbi:MAG TPA: hypothetical protein PKW35_23465, partial [Nannocystaceae bacterium]|nr:hypothetical protein [Nannocystaceae bacterium]
MSETVTDPDLLLRADVPRAIWKRSPSPGWSLALRLYLAVSFLWAALFATTPEVRWGLVAVGVLVFLAFPAFVRLALRPHERRVLQATRSNAAALLTDLRARRLVRHFAPQGWVSLQEGRLHLVRGDGKAAARAFA